MLQVSILNGSDLKTMINYTGEQVSQEVTSLCFSLLGSSVRALNLSNQSKQKNISFIVFFLLHFLVPLVVCCKAQLLRGKWQWQFVQMVLGTQRR